MHFIWKDQSETKKRERGTCIWIYSWTQLKWRDKVDLGSIFVGQKYFFGVKAPFRLNTVQGDTKARLPKSYLKKGTNTNLEHTLKFVCYTIP